METTLNQLAYDLLTIIRGGKLSQSELIELDQVKFWIKNTRATLIRQDQAKGRSISDNIMQTIPCLEVSLANTSECCEITGPCTILRTTLRIPKPLEIQQRDMIERVAGVDITKPGFTIVPYFRAIYHGNSRWSKGLKIAFYKNGYIYLMGAPANMRKISVMEVLDDPTEARDYSTCSGESCYTDDSPYPISGWMVEIMKKMILDTNFRVAMTAPTDSLGDEHAKTDGK